MMLAAAVYSGVQADGGSALRGVMRDVDATVQEPYHRARAGAAHRRAADAHARSRAALMRRVTRGGVAAADATLCVGQCC
jgi:hypothetical protein